MVPTFASVLDSIVNAKTSGIRLSTPAEVLRYDATTQAVDVQPLISEAFLDETGARQVAALPPIVNVPVAFPRGGGYRLTFPIAVGDVVLLLFSDKSLDIWLARGGQVDPQIDTKFSLADAVAIPGITDFAHPLSDAPDDRATFGQDGGPQIHVSPNGINIGTNDSGDLSAVARADRVDAELLSLRNTYNAHTHAVAGSTGTPSTPLPIADEPESTGSSTVQVQK